MEEQERSPSLRRIPRFEDLSKLAKANGASGSISAARQAKVELLDDKSDFLTFSVPAKTVRFSLAPPAVVDKLEASPSAPLLDDLSDAYVPRKRFTKISAAQKALRREVEYELQCFQQELREREAGGPRRKVFGRATPAEEYARTILLRWEKADRAKRAAAYKYKVRGRVVRPSGGDLADDEDDEDSSSAQITKRSKSWVRYERSRGLESLLDFSFDPAREFAPFVEAFQVIGLTFSIFSYTFGTISSIYKEATR